MSATPDASDVPVDVTMREINELVRLFEASDLKGLELELRGMRLVLGTPSAAPAPATAPVSVATPTPGAAAPAAAEVTPALAAATPEPPAAAETPVAPAEPVATGTGKRIEVTAPVVGTFWTAPSPGEAPFVQVGDVVTEGQQLAIVEVMKLMSPVSAPAAGRIVEMLVSNAELVEYEQVVLVIESPDA